MGLEPSKVEELRGPEVQTHQREGTDKRRPLWLREYLVDLSAHLQGYATQASRWGPAPHIQAPRLLSNPKAGASPFL